MCSMNLCPWQLLCQTLCLSVPLHFATEISVFRCVHFPPGICLSGMVSVSAVLFNVVKTAVVLVELSPQSVVTLLGL